MPFQHGTRVAYDWHGCRCEKCRAAWATYQREVRAARAELVAGRTDLADGTISTYRNHGCRCQACTEAQREANAQRASRGKPSLVS